MLSLKEYVNKSISLVEDVEHLEEGNLLQQRVNKHVSKGVSVGAISPEGAHTDTKEKLASAHETMRSDLENARQSGHIGGWSGPHKGQYRYGDSPNEVAHESSYLVHASDKGNESHKKMVNALSSIGRKHKQESVLSINSKKKANWHYLKGEKEGKSEYQGKVKYDKPLAKDTGRTELKRGGHSFTSEK